MTGDDPLAAARLAEKAARVSHARDQLVAAAADDSKRSPADPGELRVTWAMRGKRPGLNVRLWRINWHGVAYPVPNVGCWIRVDALPAFADAMVKALEHARVYVEGLVEARRERGDGARK